MASDSFTAANNTEVGSHTAEGNTWAGLGIASPVGKINDNQLGFGDGFGVSARASNSSADFSQVVFKSGTYVDATKTVHVRSSGSSQGYYLRANLVSGDTMSLSLWKHDTWLSGSNASFSRLSDHTVAIKAIPSGGDVQLKGWLDGVELTFDESASTTFTDVAANSPLAAGNPGISVVFETGMTDANSRLDDWTDTESAGGGNVARSRGMNGGFVDMSGGLQ